MSASKTKVRTGFVVCLFLMVLISAVYRPVTGFGFINFDDRAMVIENKRVQAGINLRNVKWAFTISDLTYWHPVTWISHMLDCQLFGLNAGFHHFTNLIFHIANTLLLFAVLNRMTGAVWRSAFVAGLFALHPINMEAVVWIASRKTLVSTFFWMLTLWSYLLFLDRNKAGPYGLMMTFFALGLMAKPMPVTLPFTLLLMDYWPLDRYRLDQPNMNSAPGFLRIFYRLVIEKVPLFALTALSLYISFKSVNAVVSTEAVPLKIRIANSIVSYVRYLEKWIWPQDLSIFYPFPESVSPWYILASSALLICISVAALIQARRRPYFIIGWLWFIGTLVPVIGLVQWDLWPAMADRFAYVPFIGLYVALSWGLGELSEKMQDWKKIVFACACVLLAFLFISTNRQVPNWRNSRTIFNNALQVTRNNPIAHYGLAIAYSQQEKNLDQAIYHYREALRINPGFAKVYLNLGVALERGGRIDEAAHYFRLGLEIDPDYPELHNNLAGLLFAQKRHQEARIHLETALRSDPGYANAHYNLGNVLAVIGDETEAFFHYQSAVQYDPDHSMAHFSLGGMWMAAGKHEQAMTEFAETIRIEPDHFHAYYQIGMILLGQGKTDKAMLFMDKALQIEPTYSAALEAVAAISDSGLPAVDRTD